jgi:hypothetical protein
MSEAVHRTVQHQSEVGSVGPNSSETAQYTHELIDSLRKIAKSQKEEMLAILLEAASMEARRIAGRDR